jgi:tRNA 2-thiouridine synthesizing protein A
MGKNGEITISTIGLNCPKPLIETRKAINKMQPGQILIVEGDHRSSLLEIPKAMKDIGNEVISVDDQKDKWVIRIRKVK